jgi:hypothetical protein
VRRNFGPFSAASLAFGPARAFRRRPAAKAAIHPLFFASLSKLPHAKLRRLYGAPKPYLGGQHEWPGRAAPPGLPILPATERAVGAMRLIRTVMQDA